MELLTADAVTALIRKHHLVPDMMEIGGIEIALIGQGEANLNFLITVNQSQSFNLRVGLRDKESERTLQSEFDILQIVPTGIAPRAFAVDFSRDHLNQPYMLLEYITGELKNTWEISDLKIHARTLAQLHQRKFDRHGALNNLTPASLDLLYRFDVALHYWQTHHPHLLDIPVVQRLIPSIRGFIADRMPLFNNFRGFTIVHGDAHPLNILFRDGHSFLIDWEHAEIGDPASDIADIGWDIATAWQMELTGARLDTFLDTYLALEPDDTLRERRDIWMFYTMFFGHMYNRTQVAGDSSGKHAETVQRIEAYLVKRFL